MSLPPEPALHPPGGGEQGRLSSRPMGKRKRTYTITEAARLLGLSRSAVFDAIQAGRLKATPHKVTRIVWRIRAASVRAYRVSASHQARGQKAHRRRGPRQQ